MTNEERKRERAVKKIKTAVRKAVGKGVSKKEIEDTVGQGWTRFVTSYLIWKSIAPIFLKEPTHALFGESRMHFPNRFKNPVCLISKPFRVYNRQSGQNPKMKWLCPNRPRSDNDSHVRVAFPCIRRVLACPVREMNLPYFIASEVKYPEFQVSLEAK